VGRPTDRTGFAGRSHLEGDNVGLFDRLLGRPSLDRFAADLMRGIREAGETGELRFDRAEGSILQVRDGEVIGVLNLGNIFGNYRQLPRSRRPEFLRTCVRMAMVRHRELPDDFEAASPDLQPRIWPRAALEQQRLRGLLGEPGAGLAEMPGEPVGEHLLAGLAYDWPESVQSITAENLAGWGVTTYEAMEVARRNLEEATTSYSRIGQSLYTFASGDSYDASRLTLVDRILDFELAGKPVAMTPTREQLLVTGSEDERGLKMMADLAGQALGGPYTLSGMPLILEDREWLDWMPPAGHPCRRAFRKLATGWLGGLYAEQKQLLHEVHRVHGLDVFVSTYSAVEKKDGEVVSYCVWGEGVDALLPVTDKVAIMQLGRESPVALADWGRVVDVAGDLLEPTDHYPARFRVRQLPDVAALEAIGKGEM
jgi:hypothetical protein